MNDQIWEERISPKAWEKWTHLLYFGRVYYWIGGTLVLPVHFDDHVLQVPATSWYSEGGEEMSAGGYERKSKRYKEAIIHDGIDLVRDFTTIQRPGFASPNFIVPEAQLWADTLQKWW